MKLASAIGFSTPVAMNMTVDDVKASDSDQVTISFDVSGNTKYTVAADRMDWLQKAKEANDSIQNRFSEREGIVSIGMSGGEDNPHVVVTLDQDSEESEERRGELPEEENGVRVKTKEGSREGKTVCDPNCVPEHKNFPGGQNINVGYTGGCSSTSRMWEDGLDWFGWSTAAHCFPDCSGSDDPTVIHDADSSCVYTIGEGDYVDITRDIGFITSTEQSTSPYNLKPNDHSEGVEIIDTISEEAFGIIDDEGSTLYNYGIGSCFQDYELRRWNETVNNDGYECYDTLYDQMITEHTELGGTANDGDSGSLWFVEDPNDPGSYYATGSISGYYSTLTGWEHHGPQGFTIYDIYNRAWRN